MRILHIAPSYFPAIRYGGPIWSVHGLAKGQASLGHDVHVFTTNADGPYRLNVPIDRPVDMDGVKVHYFPLGTPPRLYRSPKLATAITDQIGSFDIAHLHSVFLWPTLKAARAARRAGVPYVVSPRGMMVKNLLKARSGLLKRAWIALFERKTLEQARFIHVTADVEGDELKAFDFDLPPVISVANGVEPPNQIDDSMISPDVRSAMAGEPYILSLGRLSWKKNLAALLEALSTLGTGRLVIVGNDDEQHASELSERIKSLGIGNRVIVIARSVDGADKEALFANCCLFVLPSFSENFGNTALEAIARGKPVVVSRECGVAELVREAKCGLVCGSDAATLAQAMETMLAEPDRASAMGQAGAALAESRYGWGLIAAQMVEAYAKAGVSPR